MKYWQRLTVYVFAGAVMVSPALADDDLAAKFGARASIEAMSISPDGKHVAMVVPMAGRASALIVGDLAAGGATKPLLTSSGDPDRLQSCDWASDTTLICSIFMVIKSGITAQFTRLVAINADGSKMHEVSQEGGIRALGFAQNGGDVIDWTGDGKPGNVLITRVYVPEQTIGTSLAQTREGLGVDLLNVESMARHVVEQPKHDASDYITDGRGKVRVMGILPIKSGEMLSEHIDFQYRTPDSDNWRPLSSVTLKGDGTVGGFQPLAVDPDKNIVYGFDDDHSTRGLFEIALDGSLKKSLVLSRPDVDIDGLVRIGRAQRVVGATYVTDKRVAQYFDPDIEKLRTALGNALPGKPLISLLGSSADEHDLLLFAGSDTDPGHYYVFHRATRHLESVLPARNELEGMTLASVKPVSYPAADSTQIPGYLTLPPGSDGKNLPAIVMPHGGPGARDEWGFDWLAQFFAARGFAVLQPNFRGSTGYGDAWFQKNGFQSWRTAIGDVNDGGRWLVKQGIASPDKLAIVGWSYGGYAALQSAVLDPNLFKAIVAIAPVTDLEMLRQESLNFTNYRLVDAFIGHGVHVVEGSPARNASKIKAPVLLFHGDLDQNVNIQESRMMADRLKDAGDKVELVEFHNLDHYLDDSTARATMLRRADAFLHSTLAIGK